ncbi:MAG: glycosyltransferase [Kiritimatiellae bacterium]|nr:glycosyltransferase [Kiritimatiellia bacterium]MDD5521889.1 glycosyltransferase [Kiritimatiellia bacterium]
MKKSEMQSQNINVDKSFLRDDEYRIFEAKGPLPVVCISMAAYNQQDFISQAIDGVLVQQADFPVRLFISDDGSTDKTAEICRSYQQKYPDQITLIIAHKNTDFRICVLLLKKCFSSGAKYIAMCDGDDYWTDPLKLQKQVACLEADSDLAICFHNVDVVYDDGRESQPFVKTKIKEISTIEDLIPRDFIPTCSTVFRNRLFKEFPSWYTEYTFGDWALHFLNAEHGKIAYLDEIMAVYRIHLGGVSSKGDLPDDRRRNLIKSYEEVLKFYRQIDEYFSYKYNRQIFHEMSNYSWYLAQLYDEIGDRRKVWQYLAKSIFLDPWNSEISRRHFARTVLNNCVPAGFRLGAGRKPLQ